MDALKIFPLFRVIRDGRTLQTQTLAPNDEVVKCNSVVQLAGNNNDLSQPFKNGQLIYVFVPALNNWFKSTVTYVYQGTTVFNVYMSTDYTNMQTYTDGILIQRDIPREDTTTSDITDGNVTTPEIIPNVIIDKFKTTFSGIFKNNNTLIVILLILIIPSLINKKF